MINKSRLLVVILNVLLLSCNDYDSARCRSYILGFLRYIYEIQCSCKDACIVDEDNDGIGEYCAIEDIRTSGLDLNFSGIPLNINEFDTYGYHVILNIVNINKSDKISINFREKWWWCYAIPIEPDRNNHLCFVIDETGQIYSTECTKGMDIINNPGIIISQSSGNFNKIIRWR